jgi:hypothetical protein
MKYILHYLSMLFVPVFRLYATQNSDEFDNYIEATPPVKIESHQWDGKLRFYEFNVTTAAGSDGDTIALIKLPSGKKRVVLPMSRIAFSAFGAARTMDLGWEAYTDQDGTAVAADPNGLDDGIDVSSAGTVNPGGTVGGAETYLFDSRDGVVITAQINDAAIGAGETLNGYFIVVNE